MRRDWMGRLLCKVGIHDPVLHTGFDEAKDGTITLVDVAVCGRGCGAPMIVLDSRRVPPDRRE